MTTQRPCVFCDLVAGHREVTWVYRDSQVAAFMDIQPVNPGHVIVVPVAHASYLSDLETGIGGAIFEVARRIAGAIRASGLRADGISLSLADGEAAGQEVCHVHLHVLPRLKGDGFGWKLPANYPTRPRRSELEAVAAMISRAGEWSSG